MDRLLSPLTSWKSLPIYFIGGVLAWCVALVLSVGFYAFDLARAGINANSGALVEAFAFGFAPWLVLFPAVFRFAETESKAKQPLIASLLRAAFLAFAAFGFIIIYMIAVYAPVTGQTPGEALESQQLSQWWWDVSFFTLSYLTGRLFGQSQLMKAPSLYRIAVKSPDKVEFVDVSSLHAVSGQGNYVALICAERDMLHRATMAEMEAILLPHGFVRIHRSHLVQPAFVRAIRMKSDKVREVQLPSGQKLPVSESYAGTITRQLETGLLTQA